ncbi:hypothetical protein V8E36_003397 [Tilletia maclaganii]
MQIRNAFIVTAVVLATSAFAAPAAQGQDGLALRSATDALAVNGAAALVERDTTAKDAAKTQIATQFTSINQNFSGNLAQVKALQAQPTISLNDFKALLTQLQADFSSATTEFNNIKAYAKQTGLTRRQQAPSLKQAVNNLLNTLDLLYPQIDRLLRQAGDDLGLATINELLDRLAPTLQALEDAIYVTLHELSPLLGRIVDPLIGTITGLTGLLGINLNKPEDDGSA